MKGYDDGLTFILSNLDIEFKNLVRIISDDGIAYFDSYYVVTGLEVGTTRVGIGIQ